MYFAGGAVYESNWEKGHDQGGQYRFKDGVSLVEDDDLLVGWRYCNPVWDRRFNKEIIEGLRPANKCIMAAKSTEDGEPVHMIPPDCYDVGDGYYVPANRTVYAYPGAGMTNVGSVLRYATEEEHHQIVTNYRKGHRDPVGCYRRIDPRTIATLSDEAGEMAIAKIRHRSAIQSRRHLPDVEGPDTQWQPKRNSRFQRDDKRSSVQSS